MNEGKEFRQLGEAFRKAADIIDSLANTVEDENMDEKQKEEKEEELIAQFLMQMLKLEKMKNIF